MFYILHTVLVCLALFKVIWEFTLMLIEHHDHITSVSTPVFQSEVELLSIKIYFSEFENRLKVLHFLKIFFSLNGTTN